MRECPECGAEVAPGMKFCAECGTSLEAGQSTVSYAPSFGEEVEPSPGGADGAALIEMDQVEGTAGRRMHDLETRSSPSAGGRRAISSWTTLPYPGNTPRSCTATAATGYATSAA